MPASIIALQGLYSLITANAVRVADLPSRPTRPRHAVFTQPVRSCVVSARKAPSAAVCTAETKVCLSMALSSACMLPMANGVEVTTNSFANSLMSQRPASWSFASERWRSMATRASFTTPLPASTAWISGLCTHKQNIAQHPACCTSGESGCSSMAAITTCTPPRLRTDSWFSALVAVRFRSTPQPRVWMAGDSQWFSMARKTIWMPLLETITSWFAAL
mmetsp:Transcript_98067/g.272869  ORF Transcript_98067/g.272869 Transcript_98067/m.272869 type:complete len:219 (-) Transcript_98067:350-1006(-)